MKSPDPGSRLYQAPWVSVGHYTHPEYATGCTAIVFSRLSRASALVGGGAPGTCETDLLRPGALVQAVDAIILSGGSAFGLDCATGARQYLAERGRGFDAAGYRVPIVPSAVIFDLPSINGDFRPGRNEGYLACKASENPDPAEGRVGAGTGATVGKYLGREKASPGGLASRYAVLDDGVGIGALAVVNSFGDVYDPQAGKVVAGPGCGQGSSTGHLDASWERPAFGNTTLAVVVTDAGLDTDSLAHVARMAHDGLARTTYPAHTPYDGDVVFVVSTGEKKAQAARLGAFAAWMVEKSVVAAVTSA